MDILYRHGPRPSDTRALTSHYTLQPQNLPMTIANDNYY